MKSQTPAQGNDPLHPAVTRADMDSPTAMEHRHLAHHAQAEADLGPSVPTLDDGVSAHSEPAVPPSPQPPSAPPRTDGRVAAHVTHAPTPASGATAAVGIGGLVFAAGVNRTSARAVDAAVLADDALPAAPATASACIGSGTAQTTDGAVVLPTHTEGFTLVERFSFGMPDLAPNRLLQADAAALLSALPDASIDLVYADPPFFTGKPQHGRGGAAFPDQWAGGVAAYLTWLRPVLHGVHRVLRETGTLYLHLDWHAVHYVKVELDQIFGAHRFANELIWHYGLGAARSSSHFLRKHDTLLVYHRGPAATFHVVRGAVTPAMQQKYRHQDERGQFMHSRGRKYYLKGGKALDSVWEIPTIAATSRERLGYPTQKPETLLERIIRASSNPGDLVLDPFCGSGTTAAVAQRYGRRFIVGDASADAVTCTRDRLLRDGTRLPPESAPDLECWVLDAALRPGAG